MNTINLDNGIKYINSEINEEIVKRPKKQKVKEIYFIILFKEKDKEVKDLKLINAEFKIKNIYNNVVKQQQDLFLHQMVFKAFLNGEDNYEEFNLVFEAGIHKYTISIKVNNKMFHYDIVLEKEIKFLSLFSKEILGQNILDYFQKLNLFLAALKKNNEEDKIEILFEETINLYYKKKIFSLLISLFVIKKKKKKLCDKLIK